MLTLAQSFALMKFVLSVLQPLGIGVAEVNRKELTG